MLTTTQHSQPPAAASQHALPDPGEQVPTLSWPIVGIFTFALALFGASTWAALTDTLPAIATIAASAAAIFVLFTVLHDASHYSISSHRWVNVAFGRVAMFFVSPLISFKSFAFIHIEHHRNTNDDESDPDHFVSAAPWWQLPVRFPAMDLPYIGLLVRNLRRRPRGRDARDGGLDDRLGDGDRVGRLHRTSVDARADLPDSRAGGDVRAGVVVRLATPPRPGGHPAREPLPRDPQPRRLGVDLHSAAAVAELPPGPPPAPLDPLLPLRRGPGDATRRPTSSATRRSAPSSGSSSTPTSTASGSGSTANCCGCCRCGCRSAPRARACRSSTAIPVASVDPLTADSVAGHLRRARGPARRVPLRARPARDRPHRPRRRGRAAQLLDLRLGHPRHAARSRSSTSPAGRSPPSRSRDSRPATSSS